MDFRFRLVSDDDAKFMQALRNSKLREGQQQFTIEQSIAEDKRLSGRLFVAESRYDLCSDWNKVGSIMLVDRGGGYLGIPWAVLERGKGIGKRMVMAAAKAFPGPKRALIERDNLPSVRCAEAAGYKYAGYCEADNLLVYERGRIGAD